jgi:FAD synthase
MASVKRFVSLQCLNLRQSVGLFGRVFSPSQGRYLTQTQNKHKETSMSRVGFEPTIPAFERAKAVHALDRAATVIDKEILGCP